VSAIQSLRRTASAFPIATAERSIGATSTCPSRHLDTKLAVARDSGCTGDDRDERGGSLIIRRRERHDVAADHPLEGAPAQRGARSKM
jgi:hypothetical protein